MNQDKEAIVLSNFGVVLVLLFGLSLLCIPGIIATLRKDKDQGKIWIFGLFGPLSLYITWIKAIIWATRPSGLSIEEYKDQKIRVKQASAEKKLAIDSQKRVHGGTGALKSTVEKGDSETGPVFLMEHFGWGRIRLYKNGYIYVSTRMTSPEKLVAISGNTDLAIGQKAHLQLSGAILTIVTEQSVNTIGEGTWNSSDYFTPSTIKKLTRLVAAGNALIQKP